MQLKSVVVLAVLLAPVSTSGMAKQTESFCPNFKKAIAAASEKPAFKSLYGPLIDNFDRRATLTMPTFTNCLIEGYMYRRPSFSCSRKEATPAAAQVTMKSILPKIESCLGGTMYKDPDRATHPWVLRKTALDYPFAFVNVLNETEVVVGYVSDYIP